MNWFKSSTVLTGTVLGSDGVTVETWSADLTMGSRCVVHAAVALTGQWVAVAEQHVWVQVIVAFARLASAANHHGVAIVTWGTPRAAYAVINISCLISYRKCIPS